jgi:putative ABC transport system permease protein
MSAMIRGNFRMALASIKNTRWRSGLTMFGIVVAVVPVLTILSIGEGVKRQIADQITELGGDLVTVRPGKILSDNPIQQFNSLSGYSNTGSLTNADYTAITKTKGVRDVSPLSIVSGAITVNNKTVRETYVVGATEDLPKLINHPVQYGEFFEDKDYGRKSAVIGRGAAEKLFGEGVPLGRAFDFRDETFVVSGVLERFDETPLSFSADLDNAVIIPYGLAKDIAGETPIYEILVRAEDEHKTPETITALQSGLQSSRGGEDDFSVVTQVENLRAANKILSLLTAMITGIAAVSLLISGIGIMNIMLVSVSERMHEIGVRKAIGATRRQIVGQFMSEAIILSAFGGIVGVILAFVAQYFIRLFTEIEPVITWEAAILVTGVSLIVGVFFGSIPAIKAARKDAIAALRHE